MVTPDNMDAPWLTFEAGALSRTLDQTFVCPYLFDIRPSDLRGPLVQFQAAEDTRRLVFTINNALLDSALAAKHLERAFDAFWPDLESSLARIKNSVKSEHPRVERSEREILEEILGLVREQAKRGSGPLIIVAAKYGALDQYVDVTPIVAETVSGGRLDVIAGNHLGGDPCYGEPKELIVDYIYAGQRLTRSAREGGMLALP